jgi:hypothetical protein
MGGKVKKKSAQSKYGTPSLKHKIGMAVTGAGPITTALNKAETKLREKASKTATSVANKLGVPKPVRKVASKVATGIGTVTAGARLASRVLNPLFVPQMVAKQAFGLGVTVPGSKYIGPKNPMNLGKPVNAADKLAYEHDQAYDKYIKSGIPASQVYGSYSKADAKLMKSADTTTPEGLAAYLGMASKKLFQKKLKE